MNRLQSRRATDAEKHTTRAGQAPATAHRSNLPTPTKRSNSAPRNPAPPTSHTKNSQTPSMASSRSSSSVRKTNGINVYQNATSINTAKNTAVNGQSRGGFLSRNGKVPGKL
uniref:Uncharacterized protein n=1 Tax=Ditylenchus dipsaci TaxID=166011 RepID=A0A915CPT6_9BILA